MHGHPRFLRAPSARRLTRCGLEGVLHECVLRLEDARHVVRGRPTRVAQVDRSGRPRENTDARARAAEDDRCLHVAASLRLNVSHGRTSQVECLSSSTRATRRPWLPRLRALRRTTPSRRGGSVPSRIQSARTNTAFLPLPSMRTSRSPGCRLCHRLADEREAPTPPPQRTGRGVWPPRSACVPSRRPSSRAKSRFPPCR